MTDPPQALPGAPAVLDEKANWERPEPPVLPTSAEIERLLALWLAGRRVLGVEVLSGGLMNRNFLLRLSGAPDECVLRVYDRDANAGAKELALLALVREVVPVPEVLYSAISSDGPPAVVLSYVDGISLFALRGSNDTEAIRQAAYDAGILLARLAAFRFPRSGLLTPALDVDRSFMDGPVSVAGVVDHFLASPTLRARVDPRTRERIGRFLSDGEARVASVIPNATLAHGDFNSRNILVKRTSGGWRVSAVLDWEFALAASSYCDIGNFLRYHRRMRPRYEPSFSAGLRDGGMTLPDDWLRIARLADLPALCEMLSRATIPSGVVAELRELVVATIEDRDP